MLCLRDARGIQQQIKECCCVGSLKQRVLSTVASHTMDLWIFLPSSIDLSQIAIYERSLKDWTYADDLF